MLLHLVNPRTQNSEGCPLGHLQGSSVACLGFEPVLHWPMTKVGFLICWHQKADGHKASSAVPASSFGHKSRPWVLSFRPFSLALRSVFSHHPLCSYPGQSLLECSLELSLPPHQPHSPHPFQSRPHTDPPKAGTTAWHDAMREKGRADPPLGEGKELQRCPGCSHVTPQSHQAPRVAETTLAQFSFLPQKGLARRSLAMFTGQGDITL